jgi:hypothetical protein
MVIVFSILNLRERHPARCNERVDLLRHGLTFHAIQIANAAADMARS